jgi:uncharacterized metal-binding protein YceD (DUF177 family)
VKDLKEYRIPYTGLKPGRHTFEFTLNGKFFSFFEFSQIHEANLTAEVVLDKQSTMIVANTCLSGNIETDCDRCGDPLTVHIEGDNKLIIKFGDKTARDDEEIITLGPSEHQIDMAPFLYEYAHLALPLRKVHESVNDCNPDVLSKLSEYLVEEEENDEDEEELV